jgi:hypothetical protein
VSRSIAYRANFESLGRLIAFFVERLLRSSGHPQILHARLRQMPTLAPRLAGARGVCAVSR